MENKEIYEIVILGRGGQGAKTLGEIIAHSAGLMNLYTQAFPEFGPERSGAPVKAFVRISNNKIRTRQPIINPDCILVLDEGLLKNKESLERLKKENPLIVNSSLSIQELRNKWHLNQKLFSIDASRLSQDLLGKNFPNLGILGKFIFITEKITLESAITAYEKIYSQKLDPEKITAGKKIIEVAYHSI